MRAKFTIYQMSNNRDDLLSNVRPDVTDDEIAAATTILRRILSNILEHPLDDKYRCVNTEGKAWREQASHIFIGGSDWLVAWCCDAVLADTRFQESNVQGSGTFDRAVESRRPSLLVLGGKILPMVHHGGDDKKNSGPASLLASLGDPPRQQLLVACEEALRAVEMLRTSSAAHRQVLQQRRLHQQQTTKTSDVDANVLNAVSLLQRFCTKDHHASSSSSSSLSDLEWRTLCSSLEAVARAWQEVATPAREIGKSNRLDEGASSVADDITTVTMPLAFAQALLLQAPEETKGELILRLESSCERSFWKYIVAEREPHVDISSMSMNIDLVALRLLDEDRVNSLSTAETRSAAARAAVKTRAQREHQEEARRVGSNKTKWPPELLHTATSLIIDIGSLIEQCTVLQQQGTNGDSSKTENEFPKALQTLPSSSPFSSSSSAVVDPRMQLSRRDRIEMRALFEHFETHGDVEYLHNVKATWANTLLQLKRLYKTPTVYLR